MPNGHKVKFDPLTHILLAVAVLVAVLLMVAGSVYYFRAFFLSIGPIGTILIFVLCGACMIWRDFIWEWVMLPIALGVGMLEAGEIKCLALEALLLVGFLAVSWSLFETHAPPSIFLTFFAAIGVTSWVVFLEHRKIHYNRDI